MQLVDGIDMQAATLGVPLGNAIGPTELDIQSIEITPGAASALYGMNAINGMSNLITKNPFTSQTRNYPVDYGNPSELFFQLMITIPEGYKVDELPKNTGLTLPNGGGRFLSSATVVGDKVNIVNNLVLLKAVYNYAEYHYLREMYAQMMQFHQSQIVFKKK